jgi:hypothetical protein
VRLDINLPPKRNFYLKHQSLLFIITPVTKNFHFVKLVKLMES